MQPILPHHVDASFHSALRKECPHLIDDIGSMVLDGCSPAEIRTALSQRFPDYPTEVLNMCEAAARHIYASIARN